MAFWNKVDYGPELAIVVQISKSAEFFQLIQQLNWRPIQVKQFRFFINSLNILRFQLYFVWISEIRLKCFEYSLKNAWPGVRSSNSRFIFLGFE